MITTSNSLCRERDAQSSGRRFTSRHVRVRAFPRSNRIQPTANIANCFATSSTTERQVFGPWPLWQVDDALLHAMYEYELSRVPLRANISETSLVPLINEQ